MAKRSYSHRTAIAAIKRGGGAKGKVSNGASGNTATYPSKQGNTPSGSLVSGSSPSPAKWGGSGRGH